MKKLVAVLAAIIVAIGIISVIFFFQLESMKSQYSVLQNENNDLENQIDDLQTINSELQNKINEQTALIQRFTNRVNITGFSSSGFSPMVGLLIESLANVTIQNFGINDVEGLTLLIKSEGAEDFAREISLDVLHVSEERKVGTHYYWYLGSTEKTKVILMLGDTILDERP